MGLVTTEARQERMRLDDPRVMRALAHPARLAIVEHLRYHAATATECAEIVGLSPSATSYHLRALAKWGLVEEAPGRGDGRERLWRTRGGGWTIDTQPEDPETIDAIRALVLLVIARQDQAAREYLARVSDESPEWQLATAFTQSHLLMNAEELRELTHEVFKLLERYSRANRTDPPADARPVSLAFRAFPHE